MYVVITLAFLAMLFWGFGDFLIQRSVRHIGDFGTLFFIGVFGSIVLLPFAFFQLSAGLSLAAIMMLVIIAGFKVVASLINFQALKEGKLSVVEALLCIELPFTVLIGVFFMGDILSPLQFFLIGTIFVGVLLLSLKTWNIHARYLFEKGAVLALIAGVGLGVNNVTVAYGAQNIHPILVIYVAWVAFAITCGTYLFWKQELAHVISRAYHHKTAIGWMCFFDTAAWVCFAYALSDSMVSVTTALTEGYPLIGLILGKCVNYEHISMRQYVGMFFVLGSAITLAAIS